MAAGSLRAARTPTAAVSLMCMTAAWRVRVGCFFFSSRRRHTTSLRDWSSDVCSSDRLFAVHGMRAQIPVAAVLIGLVPEREATDAPSGRLADDRRRGRPPLAHLFEFPLGELHQVRGEPLAHARGHVDVLGDADDALAMDLAELVIEEQEVQVVPKPSVELVEDEDVPLVKMIKCQPWADPSAFLDRLTARNVEVLGLGDYEDVLAAAVFLDGFRLGFQVRRDVREMGKPLRHNAPELLFSVHGTSLTYVGKRTMGLVHPDLARPQAASRLAGHRPGRRRHRARHPEDRQGSRRLPDQARRARRPVLPARGQALPRSRAPDVPPGQRLPGRAPGQGIPVNRAVASRSAFGREAIAGRTRPRWPGSGTSWCRRSSPWPGMAWPTATCPRTTCWCTTDGW